MNNFNVYVRKQRWVDAGEIQEELMSMLAFANGCAFKYVSLKEPDITFL